MHPSLQTQPGTTGSKTKISILPPLVAERIAAGEVIERPASVVKELVENSIDAGATQVEVRLSKGGCDLIEITDDGNGMTPEDLELCVCRHATSKIKQFDDLTRLHTLGFRGEALPSIGSVAELSLTSRTEGQSETFEINVAHTAPAKAQSKRVANYNFLGKAHGTRVRVTSLFSQIPARLKFLKSSGAEASAVREILERLALTHPEVRFALWSDDRKLLDLPTESLEKRAERMLGDGNPFELLETKLEGSWGIQIIWLKGLSNPHTRSMYQIVNGRALRDRTLQSAILNPLRQSFLPGSFPSIVVKLDIPPQEIDVNAHPTKTEIRFLDSKKIFALCSAAFEKLLNSATAQWSTHLNPPAQMGAAPTIGNPFIYTPPSRENFSRADWDPAYSTSPTLGGMVLTPSHQSELQAESTSQTNDSVEEKSFSFDTTPFGQFKGVLFSTYFVFEQGEDLLLIDQHAGHERIRYERLKNGVLKQENVEQQELLIPEVIKLPHEEVMELKEKLPHLAKLGFDAEAFSEESILFRSIPAVWGTHQLSTRLKNLLERLIETDLDEKKHQLVWDETLFEKIAMEACRSSFKAGDHMGEQAAIDLTRKLMNCEHPGNCPHGRPTYIKIPQLKIEEWFNRKI